MLINHKSKQIILLPFKCWTTSTVEYFIKSEWRLLKSLHPYISGDSRNFNEEYSIVDKHGNVVPHIYMKYDKILLIRNPYERIISMWKWLYNLKEEITFEKFFNSQATKWPSCFPVTLNYPYDYIVRVEDYFDDFKKLNIHIDRNNFQQRNSFHTPEHTLTELEKEIIYWFHKSDFDVGNYQK